MRRGWPRQLVMPLEVPVHPELKRPSKRVRARTAFLARVDWPAFERRVADEVRAAVERFVAEVKPGVRVSQVAVWVDCQSGYTAMSFETRRNAYHMTELFIRTCSEDVPEGGREEWDGMVRQLRRSPYTGDTASFAYRQYMEFEADELVEIADVVRASNATRRRRWLERRSGESLLGVVRQMAEEGVWDWLPREPDLWIGVSTDRDWYDHVRRY